MEYQAATEKVFTVFLEKCRAYFYNRDLEELLISAYDNRDNWTHAVSCYDVKKKCTFLVDGRRLLGLTFLSNSYAPSKKGEEHLGVTTKHVVWRRCPLLT